MYFDNLTIAGLLMTAPYALLPLLFGREILRVREELPRAEGRRNPTTFGMKAQETGCGRPEPCQLT